MVILTKRNLFLLKFFIYLRPMKYYNERKTDLVKRLISAANKRPHDFTIRCHIVGIKLKVTGVTVRNYLQGNVADGYLGEDILKEWVKCPS